MTVNPKIPIRFYKFYPLRFSLFLLFEKLELEFAGCAWRRRQWWRRERREVKGELKASIEKKKMKNEYMSLEELMSASPGAPSERGFNNGGFKRKVHPARISQCSSVCERSVAEDEYSNGGFSISGSESGKLKKKVSFRLPEVSDIIVIPSPEDDVTADEQNVAS